MSVSVSKRIDSTDGFCFNQLASGKVKALVMLLEVAVKSMAQILYEIHLFI